MSLVFSLLIIAIIGFIAQRVGICLVNAVAKTVDGKPALLLAILMSGCWLWAYFLLAQQFNWHNPMHRYAFHPIFMLGGLMFGIGAGINQACSVSTMNKFTRGDLSMIMTMGGWFIGWCLWIANASQQGWNSHFYHKLPIISGQVIIYLFIPTVLFTLQRIIFKPEQRQLWMGIMAVGLLATVLYLLQPDWPPSRLIQDAGAALFEPNAPAWPKIKRYFLVVAMMVGMWLSAKQQGQFTIKHLNLKRFIKHSCAGILMGVGGAMALGGNDSHLLMGLPALSVASAATIFSMLLGIYFESWLYKKITSPQNDMKHLERL